MEILIISFDSLQEWNEKNGTNLSHDQLTDEQFREINETYHQGWGFSSPEEFAAAMNEDENDCPVPSEHFIRFFKDEPVPEEEKTATDPAPYATVRVWVLTKEDLNDLQRDDTQEVFGDENQAKKAFRDAVRKAKKESGLPVQEFTEDSSLMLCNDGTYATGHIEINLNAYEVTVKGVHEPKAGQYRMTALFGEAAAGYAEEHGFDAARRKIGRGTLDGDIAPARFDTLRDLETAIGLLELSSGSQGYYIKKNIKD